MEPIKKSVEGVDFIIRPVGVFERFRDLTVLQKSVLPSIAQLLTGGGESVGEALATLSDRLSPEEFDRLSNILLFKHESIAFSVDGMETQRLTKQNSEAAFKSMGAVIEIAEAVLRLNYEDFFGTVKGLFGMGAKAQ